MAGVVWGDPHDGVRFGLRAEGAAESGGTIVLELVCENRSGAPLRVFGFEAGYPRALRVSPPKVARPYIRVSFGDTAVLHPPDAFIVIPDGAQASTGLDMSFAFDRRGVGAWDIAFAYDPVRVSGRLDAFMPERECLSGVLTLFVGAARALRDAGIDEKKEGYLDDLLQTGSPLIVETIHGLGEGGAIYAVRRATRVLSTGSEAMMGWRAAAVLVPLGEVALDALAHERASLPHAARALSYLEPLIRHFRREPIPEAHLPFATMLDRLIEQPNMRGNFLLSFTAVDSQVHGHRRVDILGTGERIVSARAAGATMGTTKRSMLSGEQMLRLLEALRDAPVWLLAPMRELGLPDEPMPTLEVQLALGEIFTRRIALFNGEWSLGPGALLFEMLDGLTQVGRESALP